MNSDRSVMAYLEFKEERLKMTEVAFQAYVDQKVAGLRSMLTKMWKAYQTGEDIANILFKEGEDDK